ncbi:hypothetical protein Tco_1022006 [Tanacetum coccineum]
MTIHSAISNSSPKENWMRYSEWHFPKMITDVIYNSEYYQKYLYMAACKPRQATTVTDEEGGKKKKAPPTGKSKKPARAKQPALAKQTKPVKEKTFKPSPSKKIHKGKVMKVHKGKRSDHLVNEKDEEPQSTSKPQVEDDEYNLQRVVEGKGKGIATNEQAAQSLLDLQQPKKKSTTDQYIF